MITLNKRGEKYKKLCKLQIFITYLLLKVNKNMYNNSYFSISVKVRIDDRSFKRTQLYNNKL